MNIVKHIPVRDVRDRLTEILRFGKPYPIQDLPIQEQKIKVPFNQTAKIIIEYSQKDVLYQLYINDEVAKRTANGDSGGTIPIQLVGNGASIVLETFKIHERMTFDIYAQKIVEKNTERPAYLHYFASDKVWRLSTITVDVGLDVSLRAWITSAPTIDTSVTDANSPAARIIDYGQQVLVEIENSQEAVVYSLVIVRAGGTRETISTASVTGNLHNITLTSRFLTEEDDIVVRVQAVKNFANEDLNREDEIELLAAQLPVKVRSNPALVVSTNLLIAPYNGAVKLSVALSQKTAFYQIFTRLISDKDYIHIPPQADDAIRITVPQELDAVQIRPPTLNTAWTMPNGYVPLPTERKGTGGSIEFTASNLTEDTIFLVQARKDHDVDILNSENKLIETRIIPSYVQLAQSVVALIQPNPDQTLRFQVSLNSANAISNFLVSGGQRGIFYFFSQKSNKKVIALPSYFHKLDETDPSFNKGIGQLKTEVDFVVSRVQDFPIGQQVDLAQVLPLDPLLDTEAIAVPTELTIRAMKAQSRVAVAMLHNLIITKPVDIQLQDALVAFGGETRLTVIASLVGEAYQPFLANGNYHKQKRNGNGSDIVFLTDKLQQDTQFFMHIVPLDESGMVVEKVIPFLVRVYPSSKLTITVNRELVRLNGTVIISIDASQVYANYQLLANGNPMGDPVAGNGNRIDLISAPLQADTSFTIQATRIDLPQIVTILEQEIKVTVI